MKISFLISQNATLFNVCKDALAKVASNIELRMLKNDADYRQAAAVHGIALVIVECSQQERRNPAFHTHLRHKLYAVQDDKAIPLIYTDPSLPTHDLISDANALIVSTQAPLDIWTKAISRALGITETWHFHSDIDDIPEKYDILDTPQIPEIIPPEDLLKTAKPLDAQQFDIHISDAWTRLETSNVQRHHKVATLVQNISFHDDKISDLSYRQKRHHTHRSQNPAILPNTNTEKAKPSLLDRLLKRHNPQAIQPASLKRSGNAQSPKVPRLIPPKKQSHHAAETPQNMVLATEHVQPPQAATGFNIDIGSIAEQNTHAENNTMLAAEHVQPPQAATGFNIDIGSIAEQKIKDVQPLPPENILPLGSDDIIDQNEEHIDPTDQIHIDVAPEMLDPEDFKPQNTAMFNIGGGFKKSEDDAPEMLDPEDFKPQNNAMFNIGGGFKKSEDNAPEMLDPEDFKPQNNAMFNIGGGFKKSEDDAPEMLDPEDFKPQNTAMFNIGGGLKREHTEAEVSEMLPVNEIIQTFEPHFNFNLGGNFAPSSESGTYEPAELMPPEYLLETAEKFKKPFDFNIYPAGFPGFVNTPDEATPEEDWEEVSSEDWFEDDDDFLPPFRLEEDILETPQTPESSETLLARAISTQIEASMTQVLRKLMMEELLPVLEARIDQRFESLKAQLSELKSDSQN